MAPSRPAGPSEMRIFEQWMDTTVWLFERTSRFPKHLRHSLTQRIDVLALEILELLTTAAYERDKGQTLRATNDRLSRLRVVLRLAHALAVLPHDHYEEAARRLGEVGRLLGAWTASHGRRAAQDAPADG
jgi:hypothetical protein